MHTGYSDAGSVLIPSIRIAPQLLQGVLQGRDVRHEPRPGNGLQACCFDLQMIWAAVIAALAALPISPFIIGVAAVILRRKAMLLKPIDTDYQPDETLAKDTPDYSPYDDYTSHYTQIRSFFSVAYFVVVFLFTLIVTIIGFTLISANYHKCGALDCRIDAPSKAP
jgi:uncharacterized membrane protein